MEDIQISVMVMNMLGGLAFFLFGMEQMTEILKMVAGERMKDLLSRLTTNRFKAVFTGAFLTAVIQSSSVTTVLVVGFISAGLMTLSQSIGIILGADIGTTITAQIIAFKVTHYALILVASGFGIRFFIKKETAKHYGTMLMGLGMIFFGMNLMSDATQPLRTYEPFTRMMQQMANPLTGILVSAIFTGIIQSSAATIGVTIVLASQGLISLDAGIALVFGANIGTCVTAMLAAINKPREAVRAAAIHVLFKVAGVIIWYGFINELGIMSQKMSPSAGMPRHIANAHTIFNVANTFLFIWFVTPLAKLMEILIPSRSELEKTAIQPKYLDDILIKTPGLALERARLEMGRLGKYAMFMLDEGLETVYHGSKEDLDMLARMDNDVDVLHGKIITYLGQVSLENLTIVQSEKLYDFMAIANYIENIGDMIETNLVNIGIEKLEHQYKMSTATREHLRTFHKEVCKTVEWSLRALAVNDPELARQVIKEYSKVNQLAREVETHLADRITAEKPDRLTAFRMESDIIETFKHVYYFAKRISRLIVESDMAYTRTNPAQSAQDESPSGGK